MFREATVTPASQRALLPSLLATQLSVGELVLLVRNKELSIAPKHTSALIFLLLDLFFRRFSFLIRKGCVSRPFEQGVTVFCQQQTTEHTRTARCLVSLLFFIYALFFSWSCVAERVCPCFPLSEPNKQ